MKTRFLAVLHVTAKQFTKLANLGSRVILKLTQNIADFATPDPTVATLTTENGKLISLNALAHGNTEKKDERDAQAIKVFNLLSKELIYVNGIADGDKVLVDKSGFDSEKEPQAHDVPATPAIKKVKEGKLAASAKLQLVRPLPRGLRYTLQVAVLNSDGPVPPGPPVPGDGDFDPNTLPWSIVLQSVNSKELELNNLKQGKYMAFRVRAEDGSKKGGWSDPAFFMPH